jgi:hypothetical protein
MPHGRDVTLLLTITGVGPTLPYTTARWVGDDRQVGQYIAFSLFDNSTLLMLISHVPAERG